MNYRQIILALLLFSILISSCNKRKYTEVVEVPLPKAEEKMTIGDPDDITANEGTFQVEKLDYKYQDLAPTIDALTMELHYAKHYLYYTNALNKAVIDTEFQKSTIEEILNKIDGTDLNLKNNAGAYYNHNLFWKSIGPKQTIPNDSLAIAINANFESFELFKKQFIDKANSHIGSGWAWLIIDNSNKLQIITTDNNDNPLMRNAAVKGKPLLVIDLWEHAYYLNYQQKKRNYLEAIFKIINWKKVGGRFDDINTFGN